MLNEVQTPKRLEASPPAASSHARFLHELEKTGFAISRSAGGLDGALKIVRALGDLCPQYDGEYLYDVRFRPGFDHLSYTGSCNPIGPHTEAPLWARPPRFLALYGVRPARRGGETLLYDMSGPLDSLQIDTAACLKATKICFSRRHCAAEDYVVARPLLDDLPERCLRFSHNLFMRGDIDGRLDNPDGSTFENLPAQVRDFVRATCERFDTDAVRVRIPADALLVWDNHRMLHGRTAFRDPDRHLVRLWIDGDPG